MDEKELEKLRTFERYRLRLIEFYKKYNPSLLDSVDSTLREWEGKEEQLMKSLHEKYDAVSNAQAAAADDFTNTVEGLKSIYQKYIKPLEETYKFDHFFAPILQDSDFEAKPIVLMLGQYSVGKTSFIRFLLQRDFPGIRIGPEPTTEKFVAVMKGDDQIIPGNALCVASDHPFRALSKFGTAFMNRFEGSMCNAKILDNIILVDSPGVLSGEKQRIGRQYDFTSVIEWFANRADRILLLFDAHKLDISDEFKRSIEALRGNDDKIRVVLNKADSVGSKQLMRVYGALMWSLGKVVNTPEVLRVYIGSFWDKPINKEHDCYNIFLSEAEDLLADLKSLPRGSAVRKVNELVKRARMAKVHAYIISHLKEQMPSLFGKKAKQQKILDNLPNEFTKIASKFRLPPGDFPNMDRFKALLADFDLSKFPKLSEKSIAKIDKALSVEIPNLMRQMKLQHPDFVEQREQANPFGEPSSGMVQNLYSSSNWAVNQALKTEADNLFFSQKLTNGRLAGAAAREAFAPFGLANDKLAKLWTLVDLSKQNALDADEFAVAVYYIKQLQSGAISQLPDVLPPNCVPPNQR